VSRAISEGNKLTRSDSTYHDDEEVLNDKSVDVEWVLIRICPETVADDFHDLAAERNQIPSGPPNARIYQIIEFRLTEPSVHNASNHLVDRPRPSRSARFFPPTHQR